MDAAKKKIHPLLAIMERRSTQPENRQNLSLLQTKMSYFLPLFFIFFLFFLPPQEDRWGKWGQLAGSAHRNPGQYPCGWRRVAFVRGPGRWGRDQCQWSELSFHPRRLTTYPRARGAFLGKRPSPPVLPLCPILFRHEAWPSHSVSFPCSFSVPLCFTVLPLSGLH